MTILAVDLAARYSAACLMDDDYAVRAQFDSWQMTEDEFVYKLCSWWMFTTPVLPNVMVIEDLPHGLSYTKLVKTVLRLQGRIVQAMHDTTDGDYVDIVFLAPNAWREHHGMKRGTGSEGVFDVVKDLGYTPPSLLKKAKGNGGPSRARKVESDYCAAYLIGRFAIDSYAKYGTYDVPGTSRYHSDVILKKDFHAENR